MASAVTCDVSDVAFNPITMTPPTEYSTMYTTLMRLKESENALGYTQTSVFFDMGLVTKALEVTWSHPDELAGVIPGEDGMHLIMSIITGIGYLYGDAGLRHILHAAGTVNQMLSGKDFDRALCIRLVGEALNRRFLVQFKQWCIENNKVFPQESSELLQQLETDGKFDATVYKLALRRMYVFLSLMNSELLAWQRHQHLLYGMTFFAK